MEDIIGDDALDFSHYSYNRPTKSRLTHGVKNPVSASTSLVETRVFLRKSYKFGAEFSQFVKPPSKFRPFSYKSQYLPGLH
jgi:hypothetical protein